MSKNVVEIWSIFIGLVIGFVVAKIYQIWSILYRMEGMNYAGVDGWRGTPLWVFATDRPLIFLIIVEIVFAIIGFYGGKTFIKIKPDAL